jgi:aminobenzoyl-glutamate utilization protein B
MIVLIPRRKPLILLGLGWILLLAGNRAMAQVPAAAGRETALKAEAVAQIDSMQKQAQVMVDTVFSFGELGFQEVETTKYLTGILEREGFRIERGIAGIPTAWLATWGQGKPVISLGSDVDDIPQASQKPGVAYHAPLIEGAPGHGEGHNSGVPLNILAALSVKKIMERERLPGTLQLWAGIAEELVGTKAHFVRAGLFNNVDVVLFAHVGDNFRIAWGRIPANTGLVSVEYRFQGETAHSAGAPWRGKSALDAVELMNAGWNFRREHLRIGQRSHYVITNGGDQPNVVPANASVWYYLREADYEHIMEMWRIADDIARGAALMTGTTFTSQVFGTAWPQHFNKPIAETMYENVKRVGMPQWSEADQIMAKALQRELKSPERGLPDRPEELRGPADESTDPVLQSIGPVGGASDDIGDVSWVVPTVTLRYPANISGLPGHNWANAIAMATPIAHKGVVMGAKVQAMTMLDILLRPELVQQAWDYFRNVQTKDVKYRSLLRPDDKPAIWLNQQLMERFRPQMRELYYDSSRFGSYLEQLGIRYPTVRQ